ncbi:PREDICTED: excitatory amino acid transporter 1-like [Ceratosolen solmsi marchali]|uniref:Amino acid transporter n=1 Tax=Ceratosolen solmsi marchali TaxID=326594 RepID=A0AAJ6VN29_9HYME|nr:PREDICTED: excitatory amino acid transporter 1-like [Ceratosolen solmsi marchali]
MWRPSAPARILLGILAGLALGLALRYWTAQPWSERELMYLQFPGEIFIQMVNCLVLPLVVTSIVSASSDLGKSGSIGIKALYYYITTTSLGITLSILLSQIIRPGQWDSFDLSADKSNITNVKPRINFVTADVFLDLLRNLYPDNLIRACLSQYQTVLVEPKQSASSENMGISTYDMDITYRYTQGTNILGLVLCSLVFGLALGTMSDEQKWPLQGFFIGLNTVIAEIIEWVIKSAPISVVFLISGKVLRSEESGATEMAHLVAFVGTVLAGLAIQALLVLPLVFFISTGHSPYRILGAIGPALVNAFGTSSSTATVPTTIRCLDKLGVDPQVSRFVAPFGATINMDGIALYETIGAIFITQMRGLDLSLVESIAIRYDKLFIELNQFY